MYHLQALIAPLRRLSLAPGTRMLVAVSGGPHSVGLALACAALAAEQGGGVELRVGHVNHMLRGDESEGDEAFVRDLARSLDLELEVSRVNTGEWAREHRMSTEAAARELRYVALRAMLHAWPGDFIATGHTEDDQAETVLLNLVRGAGLPGLSGMKQQRGDVVRPFLALPGNAIVEALHEAGQPFRVDSSNEDLRHRRNFIRAQVLPLLNSLHVGASHSIARAASLLATDEAYLETESRTALKLLDVRKEGEALSGSSGAWSALHPALQSRVLRLLIGELTSIEGFGEEHIRRIAETIRDGRGQARTIRQLPSELEVWSDGVHFTLRAGHAPEVSSLEPAAMHVPGSLQLPTGTLDAEILTEEERPALAAMMVVQGAMHAFCDADMLGATLGVRSRLPGDRIHPLGMTGSRKVQDLLVDRKIPAEARDSVPVLHDQEGIVWIPGLALDRRVEIGTRTRRVAHLRYRPFV